MLRILAVVATFAVMGTGIAPVQAQKKGSSCFSTEKCIEQCNKNGARQCPQYCDHQRTRSGCTSG